MRLNRFTQVAGLLALLVAPKSLEAQTGMPFCPEMSNTEMAAVIRANDPGKRCFLSMEAMRSAFNTRFPQLQLQNRSEFADWVERLTPKQCSEVVPAGQEVPFGRVLRGRVDLSGDWKRHCRPGEVFYCDNQLGLCVASGFCWNPPVSNISMGIPQRSAVPAPVITPFYDMCNNIEGIQAQVPRGHIRWSTGDCRLPEQRREPAQVVIKRSNPWPWIGAAVVVGGVVCAVVCPRSKADASAKSSSDSQ